MYYILPSQITIYVYYCLLLIPYHLHFHFFKQPPRVSAFGLRPAMTTGGLDDQTLSIRTILASVIQDCPHNLEYSPPDHIKMQKWYRMQLSYSTKKHFLAHPRSLLKPNMHNNFNKRGGMVVVDMADPNNCSTKVCHE